MHIAVGCKACLVTSAQSYERALQAHGKQASKHFALTGPADVNDAVCEQPRSDSQVQALSCAEVSVTHDFHHVLSRRM